MKQAHHNRGLTLKTLEIRGGSQRPEERRETERVEPEDDGFMKDGTRQSLIRERIEAI